MKSKNWIAIVLLLCALAGAALIAISSHSGERTIPKDLPKEVQTLIRDFMRAYQKGKNFSVQYIYSDEPFFKEAYRESGDKLYDYRIEKAEKINDNLYALTILMKTRIQAIYHGDEYAEVYHFAGKIDGQWYIIGHVRMIPEQLRENLDISKYSYPEDGTEVKPEDVIPGISFSGA